MMKKILLIFALYLCVFQLRAQDNIEFLGVSVCGADTTDYISVLTDKGYKLVGKNEKSSMYVGSFAGLDASVMLVPFENSAKINAVVLTIDNISPVKMGSLYAELLQKYMHKYQNLKYETRTDTNGSTTTTFYGASGFVALQSKIMVMGRTCAISVYYSCSKNNTATSDGDGIGIDDI